ncbi:MAG: protein NrnU [Betaproteobacteria bacterium]|nr:protein NrnU [Betaproteobacteria bacterium]
MQTLIAGLVLFIGAHAVRLVSETTRDRLVARLGPLAYKGLVSLVSLVGLVLVVKGYGMARADPVALWSPWSGGRHIAALFSLVAFVLVVAAYVPRNTLRVRLGHPMVLGIKIWALGHLIANHTLADLVLFGSLLVWAVLSFRAARRRDARAREQILHTESDGRGQDRAVVAPSRLADLAVIVIGLALYGAFAFHLHASLIGVRPFG